jgi:hypothetical protein
MMPRPRGSQVPTNLPERLWSKIQKGDPETCWSWTGSFGQRGGPIITHRKKTLSARRVAWELVHGAPPPPRDYVTPTCGDAGCMNPAHFALKPWADVEARFWRFVVKGDGCWTWSGAHDTHGYAVFAVKRGCRRAHRVAYQLTYGPIDGPTHGVDAKVVMHRCDNPGCVRPDHLELGTNKANMHDMIAKGRAGWQRARSEHTRSDAR